MGARPIGVDMHTQKAVPKKSDIQIAPPKKITLKRYLHQRVALREDMDRARRQRRELGVEQ